MYILGVSCYYHDSAAALLKDGDLVAAVEEERFSRKKHDSSFPVKAIEYCLAEAGIVAGELDYVVFYEKPLLKFERVLMTSLGTYPKSWKVFTESMIAWFDEKLWIQQTLTEKIGINPKKIQFVEHHLSHAASAFFASPFEEAAIITIDGVGEWATATIGTGNSKNSNNKLDITHEQKFPDSLGLLYSAFTAFLGFEVNNGEYKVMGMSPYGEPNHVDKINKIFKVAEDGSFKLDMDYFSFHESTEQTFNDKFINLFGNPRIHESDFFTKKTHPKGDIDLVKAAENQYYADIAASIQQVTEETILRIVSTAHRISNSKNLCMAGGVALNSKANGHILKRSLFENMFIQPAAGDSGGALGAALYFYHVELGNPRKFVQEHCYWGPRYSEDHIQTAVDKKGVTLEGFPNQAKLADTIVEDLLKGKVVSVFQGRVEWGPRALGNRSILADPRRQDMKEIVNSMIKFREPFRPFAPVVLEEDAGRLFPDLQNQTNPYPPRFMLVVHPWEENFGKKVPAVNHLGTGRMQVIRREWNPLYYDLVKKFGDATGVPVLMNTSFNLRGEPIVNTPENALNTFYNSGIDTLVLENGIVRKPD